jgi:hypothetical protein
MEDNFPRIQNKCLQIQVLAGPFVPAQLSSQAAVIQNYTTRQDAISRKQDTDVNPELLLSD